MPRDEWNWNKDNMFFLTRDGDIEIKHSDDWEHGLFHYANQVDLGQHRVEELDKFGRNRIDKLFIHFTLLLHVYVVSHAEVNFEVMTCKKIGDKYVVRLVTNVETLEMDLSEIVDLFEKRGKEDVANLK